MMVVTLHSHSESREGESWRLDCFLFVFCSCVLCVVLGIEPRALYILDKCSITVLHLHAFSFLHSLGPQPRARCHPYSRWAFPPQWKLSENTFAGISSCLLDDSKSSQVTVKMNHYKGIVLSTVLGQIDQMEALTFHPSLVTPTALCCLAWMTAVCSQQTLYCSLLTCLDFSILHILFC